MPFSIERNDLSLVGADAIVVTANEGLQINGGVGLAVARAAGLDQMQAACDAIGSCPVGSAVATPGFGLSAEHVVHVVGPVWLGGSHGEEAVLRRAYDSALACAWEAGAQSIALPLVSAHTFGFPVRLSFVNAIEAIRAFLETHDADVRLVLFGEDAMAVGVSFYEDIAEYIDDHYVETHAPSLNVPYAAAPVDERPLQAPSPIGFGGRADRREQASAPQPWDAAREKRSEKARRRGAVPRISQLVESLREHSARGRADKESDSHDTYVVREDEADEFEASYLAPEQHRDQVSEPYTSFCPNCGKKVGEHSRYCMACGMSLDRGGSDIAAPDFATPDVTSAFAPVQLGAPMAPSAAGPDWLEAYDEAPAPQASMPIGAAEGLAAPDQAMPFAAPSASLSSWLDNLDAPFSTTLLALIDARGYTDAEVYKRANMSRQLFSKIRSDAAYRPTKKTVLALAIALGLDLSETCDLLGRAGFALSHSNKADVIVEYFIVNGDYDIFAINEALYAFDQPLL